MQGVGREFIRLSQFRFGPLLAYGGTAASTLFPVTYVEKACRSLLEVGPWAFSSGDFTLLCDVRSLVGAGRSAVALCLQREEVRVRRFFKLAARIVLLHKQKGLDTKRLHGE